MTKAEFEVRLAEKTGMSKLAAAQAFNAMLEVAQDALLNDGEVTLHGLGILKVCDQEATQRINPRTGERVSVPAKKRVKFRTSIPMKRMLNK